MVLDVLKNKIIARFAFRQTRPAIFKLYKRRNGSSADALKIRSLGALTRCAVRGMTIGKRHDYIVQSGRSMIEMLGVLAIIGVLSVGGLVGYSKAIERYKVNETINHITHIVTNTRTLFKNQKDFYTQLGFKKGSKSMSDETNATRIIAERAKLFPEAISKNGYKNLFGGDIRFFASGKFASGDGKAFHLNFFNVPQMACIEILTRDWQNSLGIVAMRVVGSTSPSGLDGIYSGECVTEYSAGGGIFCASDIPVAVDRAVAVCDTESNQIAWKFY